MGHYIAEITLTRAEAEASIARRDSHLLSETSSLIFKGVEKWRDEEADRWDSANYGKGYLAPVLPSAVVGQYLWENHSRVAAESVVIPVADDADVKTTTKKIKLSVTADELASIRSKIASDERREPLGSNGMTSALHERLREQHGAHLTGAKVLKVPAPRKPAAAATEGKATTSYRIIAYYGTTRGGVGIDTKPTQAEARAAALALMEQDLTITRIEVDAYVERVADDGKHNPTLVTVTRPAPRNATVDVELIFQHAKPNAKPASYIVAFDVHH